MTCRLKKNIALTARFPELVSRAKPGSSQSSMTGTCGFVRPFPGQLPQREVIIRERGRAMWKNLVVSVALLGALSCAAVENVRRKIRPEIRQAHGREHQ